MVRKIAALLVLFAFACQPVPAPAPMPPDATDGAPTPLLDGSPATPCSAACSNLSALGCPVATDCVTVLAHVDGARLVRLAGGTTLTCAMLAAATSKAAVQSLGVSCP
jgi:hypothetical protein